jgi:molybdopterin-guanine dinucleotide biosynthesis protein A
MFSIVIQAGGKSSRMGTDKSLLSFRGTTLLDWLVGRVAHLTDDLLIISNNPALQKRMPYPVYPDIILDRGPLGGLFSGLSYAKREAVAMIACDMPLTNPVLLAEEARLLDDLGVDVVIPAPDGKTEPLHAVYRKSTCLAVVDSALQAGRSRLIEWHDQVRVHAMDLDAIKVFDPEMTAFININTPDDLRIAEI